MSDQPKREGGGRKSIGDIAPKLAELTDDVLFDDLWNREGLNARGRTFITVAALVTSGAAAQLKLRIGRAIENGVTRPEITEAITHLAFYAGWPRTQTAAAATRELFDS